MIRTIAASVFALLTVTAPAYAANLIIEDVNLNFGNGYTASGNFGVLTLGVGFAQFPTLSLNSSPLAVSADFTGVPGHVYYGTGAPPSLFQDDLAFRLAPFLGTHPPLFRISAELCSKRTARGGADDEAAAESFDHR
jgi:hypothetical protein